jgi:hypothetical protein
MICECGSDLVCEGKIIWSGDSLIIKMLNDKQPIDYHCLECKRNWREEVKT